ncbi:MAG: nitroreductase family protein [Thermoplasmatota archaeon]
MKTKSNGILSLITSRRSIRRYTSQQLSQEDIKKIVEAGRWAPSAVNGQPWRFIVISDSGIKKQVGDASRFYKVVNRHASDAAVIIAVCAKNKTYRWADMDCAIASQTMMLQAHSLGIGSCFLGIFNEEKIKQILGLPEKMKVVNLITLGYPDGEGNAPPRLSFDDIVFYDGYDKNKKSGSMKEVVKPKSGVLSVLSRVVRKR